MNEQQIFEVRHAIKLYEKKVKDFDDEIQLLELKLSELRNLKKETSVLIFELKKGIPEEKKK